MDSQPLSETLQLRDMLESLDTAPPPTLNEPSFQTALKNLIGSHGAKGSADTQPGKPTLGGPPLSSQPPVASDLSIESFRVGDSCWEVYSQSLMQWLPCEVKAVFIEASQDDTYFAPARSIKVQSQNGIKYVREPVLSNWMRRVVKKMVISDVVAVQDSPSPVPHEKAAESASPVQLQSAVASAVPVQMNQAVKSASPVQSQTAVEAASPVSKRPKVFVSSQCTMDWALDSVPKELIPYIKDLVPKETPPSEVQVNLISLTFRGRAVAVSSSSSSSSSSSFIPPIMHSPLLTSSATPASPTSFKLAKASAC
eukprot:5643100-Pyramimonas_sp.AAC.2